MPTLSRQFELKITPEIFLNACSPMELQELSLLLDSPRFSNKMTATDADIVIDDIKSQFEPIKQALKQAGE